MDATAVNRILQAIVRPLLRDQGFRVSTARSAWRHREGLIDVVNFQSFNRYNADVLGCTPFSFAVNLGVYLTDVPSDYPLPVRAGQPAPEEYRCHIRRRLKPLHPILPKAADVWVINETGLNVEDTVQAAAFELLGTGTKWFEAFRDTATVLAVLQEALPSSDDTTRSPGLPDSPAWNTAIGYLARALEQTSVAARHLRRALDQLRDMDAQHSAMRLKMPKMVPRHLEEAVAMMDGPSA
ncbi:MAG TPA: DUF4304 domain-containing protein [Vicinamibacterales bacterium]|nr:DUF4304 domain-containing protein [Vicinamibacterales bacterium]